MFPFLTPGHKCHHLLYFLQNSSHNAPCPHALEPSLVTLACLLLLPCSPGLPAFCQGAPGLLLPSAALPGVRGCYKSEAPKAPRFLTSFTPLMRWSSLLSMTAFSYKEPLTHKILHRVAGGYDWEAQRGQVCSSRPHRLALSHQGHT